LKTIKVAILALACVGCAKFPDAGSTPNFTRVTIRMKVAGKINTTLDDDPTTSYIYDIALRATSDLNPQDQLAPQPVAGSNNPNGRMAGSPTHFIEFDSQNPNSSIPFKLYRFATQQEIPNPSDPNNPINLAHFAESTRGRIVSYQRLDDDPTVLKFDIFINQLADDDTSALQLNTLMVNFFTMSRLSSGVGGTRVIDSFGDNRNPSEFNSYVKVDLRQDGTYGNLVPGIYQNREPTGDCFPGINVPDLDISDWTIEVHRQN
jgi:hypothetical protein